MIRTLMMIRTMKHDDKDNNTMMIKTMMMMTIMLCLRKR